MNVRDASYRFLETFLWEPLRRLDREQREYMALEKSQRPDWKVVVVLITSAIVLTLQNYLGGIGALSDFLAMLGSPDIARKLDDWMVPSETRQIRSGAYWALFSFATYFFIPWFVIAVVFRQSLSDYGCKLRGAFADGWIYFVFFLVMGPLLLWVSTHRHFQLTFPFYKLRPGEALWPYFWMWELLYFVQFLGLEFFFRGFMVHGTKHRFGVYSIYVMALPYCMIHFQKPMLESFGAIIAGIVLGFMSLKNRSIWMGASIHMSVALSMDMLSLWRQGQFG